MSTNKHTSVLLCDYLIVRRGRDYNLVQLYKPHGLYWYNRGSNPRAIVALLVGMAPQLPGLVHAINPAIHVAKGELEFYTFAWLEGLIFAM